MKTKTPLHRRSALFVFALLAIFTAPEVDAQTNAFTNATYTFGADGNVSSFAYNGSNVANLTEGNMVKSDGITTSSSSGNFRATGWTTGSSLDTADYIGFTLTADSGWNLNMTNMTFGIGRSGTGTRAWAWYYSTNSFSSSLVLSNYTTLANGVTNTAGVLSHGDVTTAFTGNVLNLGSLTNLGTVEFRLYSWLSEAGTGTAGLQGPLSFSGAMVANAEPPPAGSELYWTANSSALGGTGTWNTTGSNWSANASPVSGAVWDGTKKAIFTNSPATVTVATVTASAGIQFATDGYTLSSGTLTLGGANAASNTITTGAGVNATINSVLAGSAGLTKAGTGKLVLSGNNSTLSGGITLSAGTLSIASGNALGNNALQLIGGTLSSADGTARTIANAITVSGNVGLGEANTGNLTLPSVNLGNSSRTLSVGENVTVTLSDVYGSGGLVKAGTGSLIFAANGSVSGIGISAGTATINQGITLTTSSQLASTGGTLNINGTLLSTATTGYTAPTGQIIVGSQGRIIAQGNGTPTNLIFDNNVTWEEGSEFIFRDFTLIPAVSNRTFRMDVIFESTSGTMNVGAISGAGALTFNRDLTIGQNVNFNFGTYTGTLTASGNVTVGGTFGAVNGVRSFTIQTGKELVLQNDGTLNMADDQTLTVQGTVRSSATAGQTATMAGGGINLGGGTRTFDVAAGTGGAGLQVSSIISNGSLTKAGGGRLLLSAANTFAGATTISGGTLELARVGGESLSGTSGLTVGSGATLLISESNQVRDAATVTLSGGTITRGSGVSEVFGNLNLTAASFLDFGSGGTGTISFGTYTPSALTALNIVNFTQGNTLTFGSNLTTTIGNSSFFQFQNGGIGSSSWDGSTFTITAIPEPSTYLAAAGLLSLMLWPSRKRIIRDTKKILGLTPPMRDRLAARKA